MANWNRVAGYTVKGENRLDEFLAIIKGQGWKVQVSENPKNFLPQAIKERYTNIPQSWLDFIGTVRSAINNDGTIWFLCKNDFEVQSEGSFRWNEWEIISLESAENDVVWETEIKQFWTNHLPIIMSVKNGYSYYAISMENGSIVHGAEPEFEACNIVANSFEEFMKKIIKHEIFVS